MEFDDTEEVTAVTDARAAAARAGMLELADSKVAEMLRKYTEGK